MRLLYILRGGRLERLRDGPGQFPDELFYGYCQLAKREGWQAELLIRSFPSKVGFYFQQAIHRLTNLSPDLSNIRRLNRALLHQHDIIVSMSEPVLFMLALNKRHAADGAALVLILIGAEKRLRRSHLRSVTRRMFQWVLSRMQAVIVLGEGEYDYLVQEGLIDPGRLHLVQFGVDVDFWTPAEQQTTEEYVLSLGNDEGRDYGTLLDAIGTDHLRLHTVLPLPRTTLPPNVIHTKGDWIGQSLSDVELRDLYRTSRVVVVPLKDSSQPQGQSVTLQAMACGKAVILSRTRGLWSHQLMRHMENCYLVPAGDSAALRAAIAHLSRDHHLRKQIEQAARQVVEKHFSSDLMADRIGKILMAIRPEIATI